MSGDTLIITHGSTLNVEGQFLKDDGTAFAYTDASVQIHDTLNLNLSEIDVVPLDKNQGTFTLSITDLESKKMPEGRNSWVKLRLFYSGIDPQYLVFPPIWFDVE